MTRNYTTGRWSCFGSLLGDLLVCFLYLAEPGFSNFSSFFRSQFFWAFLTESCSGISIIRRLSLIQYEKSAFVCYMMCIPKRVSPGWICRVIKFFTLYLLLDFSINYYHIISMNRNVRWRNLIINWSYFIQISIHQNLQY